MRKGHDVRGEDARFVFLAFQRRADCLQLRPRFLCCQVESLSAVFPFAVLRFAGYLNGRENGKPLASVGLAAELPRGFLFCGWRSEVEAVKRRVCGALKRRKGSG